MKLPDSYWRHVDTSADDTRALLYLDNPLRLLVVTLATGDFECELTLTAIDSYPTIDPTLGADIKDAAALVASFPQHTAGRLAATTDGAQLAFTLADGIYLSTRDGTIEHLTTHRPLFARFSPDDKLLYYGESVGNGGGYQLYDLPARGLSNPRIVTGGLGLVSGSGRSARGIRFVTADGDSQQFCVLETRGQNERAASLHCEHKAETPLWCNFSPSARWVACASDHATRLIDVQTHRVISMTERMGEHRRITDKGTLEP